jgi:radical SAM superfamily enzyme YgiQ (UPF0313 family)
MLALINTNRMVPPIGPLGLEYVAGVTRRAGIETDVVDLCLAGDPSRALSDYFASHNPRLVGLSFRNVDDCFWPSAKSFVPELVEDVRTIRELTDAAIVLGGVGYSIFAERLVEHTGVDFGIRGDGEQATVSLCRAIEAGDGLEKVDGLVWRADGEIRSNRPAWPASLDLPTSRRAINNLAYFERGGQAGIETKRGCNRMCIYCAERLAKGSAIRTRTPSDVADEVEALASQGVDVMHLCDSEFNIPREHAYAVCRELSGRELGDKVRWYGYLAVTPFDVELAEAMRRAGCVGINFTGDSACQAMLETYRQPHRRDDLANAVRLCRENGIAVMFDLMLGGPGETEQSVRETIEYVKKIDPDCAGAALGIRIYPGIEMARIVASEGPPEDNPNILRKYEGPVDYFKPTFYISHELGANPARLVKDIIGGDSRFFEPTEEIATEGRAAGKDHNYNDNTELVEAIRAGERGAYWDILRRLRS